LGWTVGITLGIDLHVFAKAGFNGFHGYSMMFVVNVVGFVVGAMANIDYTKSVRLISKALALMPVLLGLN